MKAIDLFVVFLMATILYIMAAEGRYRFAHPEQTETQLFLNTGKWLRWKL